MYQLLKTILWSLCLWPLVGSALPLLSDALGVSDHVVPSGYEDYRLSRDAYLLTYNGVLWRSPQRLSQVFLMRAAEITKESSYTLFELYAVNNQYQPIQALCDCGEQNAETVLCRQNLASAQNNPKAMFVRVVTAPDPQHCVFSANKLLKIY